MVIRPIICVLTALRERLSCKEVWVVGANRYRNPDDDLPTNYQTANIKVMSLPL